MLVEDSPDDALLLLRELRRGGFEPEHERVETPEGMKRALTDFDWDVIVSDYRMPRFGAPEALAVAREAGSGVPFIVVSGKVGEELAVEVMKAGAHDYVMKNDLTRLCPTVERGLKEAEERRDRRRIEEELRQSEERYRAVVEQATDGIYLLDAESRRLLETNPAFQRMLGYTEGELRGMEVHDFVAHPREDVEATIRRTLERKRRLVGDRRYRRKDGTLLDVEVGVSVISYGGREVICTIARDVTERKKGEEALSQSERLYRAVVEQATENIFLVDVETLRVVESNSAFRQALGYSEEELSAMTLYDVVAADRESVEANVRLVVELQYPSVGERQYRCKDGSLLYVEVSASIILRDDRKTLCVVAHDITERAKAQQLLERRVTGLSRIATELTLDRPTETVLGALAESVIRASTAVACLVLLLDEDGRVRPVGSPGLPGGYVEALRVIYGGGTGASKPDPVPVLEPRFTTDIRRRVLEDSAYAPIHPFMREAPWDAMYTAPLRYRGRALGAAFLYYLPDQAPGEDERVFLRAVADQAAVVVENARLFVEARGKAALEERQKLARELHDSVSQALYGIALGAKAARERLDDGEPEGLAEPLDYVLSLAEAGMAEMRALIFELRPESLESEGLVAALEKQVAALEARHGIRVEHRFCEEPDASLPAKETVYRIAQEALHNVVKHARAKKVRVTLVCDPERMEIEVSDDGVGFDPDGDFPGHLGLRSMRERAARSGGAFEIESVPGGGTGVRVHIPV